MQVPTMSNQQGLSIVRQIAVGTKERIAIVQAGEDQYLVGITTQSIQLISTDKPLTQEMLKAHSQVSFPANKKRCKQVTDF